MNGQDFTTTITVDNTPAEAYKAINNVRGWWSEEIEGSTDKLNAEFDYHFEDIHRCKIKLTEMVPDKKVVWSVLENYFKFTESQTEWKDSKVLFEISEKGNQTEIRMTHQGLVPEDECFDVCQKAWTQYVGQSLYNLITNGKGSPNGKENPQTEDEKKFIQDNK